MAVNDKIEVFQEDTIRLFNAAKSFEKKFTETSKNLTEHTESPKKIVKKKKPPSGDLKKKPKNTVSSLHSRNFLF